MKASSLLFSLPLLLTTLAANALPRDSQSTTGATTPQSTDVPTTPPGKGVPTTRAGADAAITPTAIADPARGLKTSDRLVPGETEFPSAVTGELRTIRARGGKRQMEIMTDQFHVRHRDGTESVVKVPAARSIADVTELASLTEFESGHRADLVAYIAGRPKTDRNKMLITKRISVRLADGVTPSVFAKTTGALRAERLSFAQEALILTYASAVEAIEAVERLRTAPGVLDAENLLAVKRIPERIPSPVQFFPHPSGPEYRPLTWTDVVVHWDYLLIINTSAYQWWANNEVNPFAVTGPGSPFSGPGPWASPPSLTYLGDYLPIQYNPLTPLVHGEQADLRLPVVWEIPGDFDRPISGRLRKILVLDDGIQKSQPDLQLAVDLNSLRHYNYFTRVNSPEPLIAAIDSHGTSLAGFAGARIKNTGSRIAGVAPGCVFQAGVVLRGYVDPVDWAQAFAQGSTLTDSDEDNDLLDEDRTGLTYFEICLNASTVNGTQDASDLYPEDWLWRRAIRFGAQRGRALKGVIYVTSAGNGAEGHMNTNYMEQKNSIYQIPVGSISDHGRQIAYSNKGANLVCVGLSGTDELPPIMDWPSAPPGWPASLPIKVNAPVEAEDIPYRYRRISQGVPTIATDNRIDFDFQGTSASAAQVAGIVALMLEANQYLQARDVKEILLRSCRVCNDVRTTHDDLLAPTQWRMSRMGVPLHYSFGAGLVDANRAVQIALRWPPLPFNPLPSIKLDVSAPDFGMNIAKRNSETGGIYYPIITNQLIPVDGRTVEIIVPAPPSGMRVEHVEVRVQLYHKRRGDLEIKLVAPGEVGWEAGRTLDSDLFVPHREDYTESRWHNTEIGLRDPTDWTFTTVRHWGTRVPSGGGGIWKVLVRDAVDRGANANPDLGDPVGVPVANPTDVQSQRLAGIGITYHGTFGLSIGNEPPVVTRGKFRMSPGTGIVKASLTVDELGRDSQGRISFPITSWDFFHPYDIVPPHVTPTAHEPFEYFPPAWRNPASPPDLDPPDLLRVEAFIVPPWPSQPFTANNPPLWISFSVPNPNNLIPPTTGSSGGMTSWPLWSKDADGNPAPMERSADGTFMIVRDARNRDNLTNFIGVRLNRKKGELEVIPQNAGRYEIPIYAENLLGKSRPKTIEIGVVEDFVINSWQDFWWNEPELSDQNIVGWNADPDGDGLANGLEYMMRLNPTLFDSDGIPGYRIEGNEVVFTYSQDTLVTDGVLRAQISDGELGPTGFWEWADVTPTVLGELNGMRDMEVRIAIADSRLFFRLFADGP